MEPPSDQSVEAAGGADHRSGPSEESVAGGQAPQPGIAESAETAGTAAAGQDIGSADSGLRVQFAPRRSRQERLRQRRKRRRWRRVTGLTLVGLGVVILATAGWVAWRAYQAYQHLQSAASLVSQIEDKVKDVTAVDTVTVRGLVGELQKQAAAGRNAVSDPVYGAVSHVPWIGPNLAAVRSMAVTIDDLARNTVPSLLDISEIVNGSALAPHDGVINLAPIERVSGALQSADQAVRDGRARIAAIGRSDLVEPVAQAVLDLWHKLDQASALTAIGARVGRLMPEMLGSDGARTYLVVFQNPAELRATGGIFGSYALVRVDQGKIAIQSQGSSSRDIGSFTRPVVQQSPQLRDLYSGLQVTSPMDVNFTPDYPTAAATFAAMYEQRTGTSVDGVLALDPVAISYLLRGHEPIDVGHGIELTSQNVVQVLLSKAYAMFPESDDADARDVFLAAATQDVFSAIMSGGSDPKAMLNGLKRSASEHRLLIWSAHSSEEADLAQTTLAGKLGSSGPGAPHVGVYFNDGTGAKLGYYLDGNVQVAPGSCAANGSRRLSVSITMRYNAPSSGLPDYVLGLAAPGEPYVLRTNVLIVAPSGGSVSSIKDGGSAVPVLSGRDQGRPVSVITVDLAPGQKTTVAAVLTVPSPPGSASGQSVLPVVDVTPGVHTWPVSVSAYPACRTEGNAQRDPVPGR